MKNCILEKRAVEFARLVSDVAMDEEGIVRGLLHFDEKRPLRDADLPANYGLNGNINPAAFVSYEDAAMTTGEFLAAQSLRYAVTGEDEARELANRAYTAIQFIYKLGTQKTEGYFPKPYGRKISEHISRDQYLYSMVGMWQYRSILENGTQSKTGQMITSMANYWMMIQYTQSYFGLPATSQLSDFMASLFLGIIGIARSCSNEERFRLEYERLFHEEQLGSRMKESLRGIFLSGETYDGGTCFRQQENPVMMKTLTIDHLWDADPENRKIWSEALLQLWEDDMLVMLDRADGMNYWFMGFDPKENRTFLTPPGVVSELENPLNYPILTWGGHRKTASSAKTAYCAAIVADRLGITEARDVAHDILIKTDLSKFRAFTVPDESHLPPGAEWFTQSLHVEHLCAWQWAFWTGKKRELW